MLGLERRTSCRPLFKQLGILTVPGLYMLDVITFARLNSHQITTNEDVHTHNTRRKNDFHASAHSLAMFTRSPLYAGSLLYNKLPLRLKKITNNIYFRKQLKAYLIDQSHYSLDEFLSLK
jgi:hypothetical protein